MRPALIGPMLCVLLAAQPSPVSASDYLDGNKADYLIDIQTHLFNDRFPAADSIAAVLVELHGDDPAGYLFRAITLITLMFDREQDVQSSRFHELLDSAQLRASAVRDTAAYPTRAWMCLWTGHAYAYRALWEARFGSTVAAITAARQARDHYQMGLAYDSTLYDLYFGLGMYHYWKSAGAGFLRRLGLIRNEMDKGIKELRTAADSSSVSRSAARNALIWVWFDRKWYDSVIIACREARRLHPDGRTWLWPLGRAYFEKKEYDRAAEVYRMLRGHLAQNPGNYFNLVECDYFLYRCYDKLGREIDAAQTAARVLEYRNDVSQKVRRRQRDKLALLQRAARSR